MTSDEVVAILHAERSGNGWRASCPAHEDSNPSLSISEGDGGQLLLRCHAGCDFRDILAAIRRRNNGTGITSDNNTGNGSNGIHNEEARTSRRIVATYTYTNESGEILYQTVRFAPKNFRQRRPDGVGSWIWSIEGVRRVLYNLRPLRGEPQVFVVEGEKDVQALCALGVVATTNVCGAGKWSDTYTDQLLAAGVRRVVILPDNDQAGQDHAMKVGRSCVAAGLSVKIVRLPGLQPKGDVSDWLAAGHSREQLYTLVDETPDVDEASLALHPTGPVVMSFANVAPEPVDDLWPKRVARGKVNLITGDPGQGKTLIALDIAARISKGDAWPDGGSAPEGNVLVMSAEDGPGDTIRPRLEAFDADLERVHLLKAIREADGERTLSLDGDLLHLETAIMQTHAILVIIDPLSAYLGKPDSYKDAEIRRVLTPLAALAEKHRVAIIGILHLTKASDRRALYRVLGSIGFVAAARNVLAVGPDPDNE